MPWTPEVAKAYGRDWYARNRDSPGILERAIRYLREN